MINQDKPTTAVSNATKVSIFETWATITTTWASETRTWLDMTSIIENTSKPSTTLSNVAKP
jgi:hypothetical protein